MISLNVASSCLHSGHWWWPLAILITALGVSGFITTALVCVYGREESASSTPPHCVTSAVFRLKILRAAAKMC